MIKINIYQYIGKINFIKSYIIYNKLQLTKKDFIDTINNNLQIVKDFSDLENCIFSQCELNEEDFLEINFNYFYVIYIIL